jgi:UTP--glucose-1-phosphate uridylyltransferase
MDVSTFHAVEFEGDAHDCGSKLGYFKAVCAYAVDHDEIGDDARGLIKGLCLLPEYRA